MKRAGAWLLLLLAMAARADEAELQGFITDNTMMRTATPSIRPIMEVREMNEMK